jgi:hypothetical protein
MLGVLIGILLMNPTMQLSSQDLEWVVGREDEFAGLLESLKTDSRIADNVGIEVAETRAAEIENAFEKARRDRARDLSNELADAPIDPAKVKAFTKGARSTWDSARLLGPLFAAFSTYEILTTEAKGPEWFGRDELLPKGLFTSTQEVHGLDMVWNDIGESIARGEVGRLVESIQNSRQSPPVLESESFQEAIRRAAEKLESEGFSPAVIMVPISWRLQQTLEVGRFFGADRAPSKLNLTGAKAEHWYEGSFEGLEVFESTRVPQERVYVIDLAGLGRLRQWTVDEEGHLLRVELSAYDTADALEAVARQPELFADAGDDEHRAQRLRERVRSKALERFEIVVEDPAAAIYVPVPNDLQGPA